MQNSAENFGEFYKDGPDFDKHDPELALETTTFLGDELEGGIRIQNKLQQKINTLSVLRNHLKEQNASEFSEEQVEGIFDEMQKLTPMARELKDQILYLHLIKNKPATGSDFPNFEEYREEMLKNAEVRRTRLENKLVKMAPDTSKVFKREELIALMDEEINQALKQLNPGVILHKETEAKKDTIDIRKLGLSEN